MANLDSFADRTSHLVDQETRIGDASREERDARYTPLANTTTLEVDNDNPTEAETLIDVLLQSVIIHSDRPMENLPTLSPPELKVIGRCVTLKGETHTGTETIQLYYEGLVGTINKDTVMLIHVNRYTEEDWQVRSIAHVNRCDEKDEKTAGTQGRGTAGVAEDPPNILEDAPADPTSPVPENGMNRAEDTARVRNHLQNHTGSMGPIPFMTFARNRISNVEFGKDPRSSFYSLFRDPSKEHFDMQCLRMFCRRYIVHTAQGSNPKMIPLRSFVTTRCNCPDLDNDLLVRVTREEIAHLVKVEREIKRTQRRKERRQTDMIGGYQTPRGFFHATRILYLLRLPQKTFMMAVVLLVVSSAMVLFSGVSFSLAEVNIVYFLIVHIVPWVVGCTIVWLTCALLTMWHCTRMHIPITGFDYVFWLCMLLRGGSLACAIMLSMICAKAMTSPSVEGFLISDSYPLNLCRYYATYSCSGFTVPCSSLPRDHKLCRCNSQELLATSPCAPILLRSIYRLFIPLTGFCIFVLMITMFSLYLGLRFWKKSALMRSVMNPPVSVDDAAREA